MSEWQPIETARAYVGDDEDKQILVWTGYSYDVVTWSGVDDHKLQWFNGDVFLTGVNHWMPLPPPPVERGQP